jgi:hypothetical protein
MLRAMSTSSCLTRFSRALVISAFALAFTLHLSHARAQNTAPEPTGPEPDLTQAAPDPESAPPPPPPASEPVDADSAAPPPPPPQDGDYAGRGGEQSDPLAYESEEELDPSAYEDDIHEFSIRIDPLNWLLLGRLGVELELGIWKFISVELIPVFVTSGQPIALNYSRLDDNLTQHSRGVGPISGASLGVGFWIFGEPFSGYVIRLNFTNYAYKYEASDGEGVFDRVDYTERRVTTFFGSHSRFGPFTLAGGLGLGLELNQEERCGLARAMVGDRAVVGGRSSDCDGRQQIALDRNLTERADLNGPLHPVYFEARFSIGLVF